MLGAVETREKYTAPDKVAMTKAVAKTKSDTKDEDQGSTGNGNLVHKDEEDKGLVTKVEDKGRVTKKKPAKKKKSDMVSEGDGGVKSVASKSSKNEKTASSSNVSSVVFFVFETQKSTSHVFLFFRWLFFNLEVEKSASRLLFLFRVSLSFFWYHFCSFLVSTSITCTYSPILY
jgi:hypothetical protein